MCLSVFNPFWGLQGFISSASGRNDCEANNMSQGFKKMKL